MTEAFIATDLVTLQTETPEMGEELTDTVRDVARSPGIDNFGSVTVAEGEHAFIPRTSKVTEAGYLTRSVCGLVIDQGSDMIERDH
jgi:hypothetical protein